MALFRPRILHRSAGLHGQIEVAERGGVRTLHLGSTVVQSAMRVADPLRLELHYTRAMMGFLLFRPEPRHVLLVGLGGGSLAKFVHFALPRARVRVVEIDPAVVTVARAHFHVPQDSNRFAVEVADAGAWLAAGCDRVDAILLDAFGSKAPPQALVTEDFFASVLEALEPGGVAALNLWATDPDFSACITRLERVFDHQVLCLPVERPGNVIVFAFRAYPGPIGWDLLRRRATELEQLHGLEFPSFVRALAQMNPHDPRQLLL